LSFYRLAFLELHQAATIVSLSFFTSPFSFFDFLLRESLFKISISAYDGIITFYSVTEKRVQPLFVFALTLMRGPKNYFSRRFLI